jgi:endonuclease III-like uncharacterized protein
MKIHNQRYTTLYNFTTTSYRTHSVHLIKFYKGDSDYKIVISSILTQNAIYQSTTTINQSAIE